MYKREDASDLTASEMLSPDEADGEICLEEVESVIRSLKCVQAAGADEVTAEMIKYGGPRVWDFFWFLYNLCWKSGEVPDYWRGAVIVPLYKGVSFYNLRCHGALYPTVCSTAARSSMRLIYAGTWRSSLLVDVAKILAALVKKTQTLCTGMKRRDTGR